MIIGIRPKASEFKAIAGFFFFGFATFGVLDGVKAGAVGIVFGISAIGNDENLLLQHMLRIILSYIY